MDKLQIFDNPNFGKIRMVKIDGKPYAVGIDVARALEYAKPNEAIRMHCKGDPVTYGVTDALGRTQETRIIPEGDIYRLIVKAANQSRNPGIKEKAERFERWIFDEVLPSIRKTGEYKTPKARPHSLTEINNTVKLITGLCDKAGVAPQFQLVAVKNVYASVGIDIPVNSMPVSRQLFEPTEIARRLHIMSSSGKPHAQAISAIIAKLPIEKGEREPVPFSVESSGHFGTHYQYSGSVISKIVYWLEQRNHPAVIEHGGKSYKVFYKGQEAS